MNVVRCSFLPLFSAAALTVSCLATTASIGDTIPFRRGDSNVDGTVDLSDAVHSLGFLFLGSPSELDCLEASDSNGDATLDLTDAVYTLVYLFQGGQAPPVPGPLECGTIAVSALGCDVYPACASPPEIASGPAATPGITVPGRQVTLSVTASDPDGDPLSYSWVQTEPAEPRGIFVSGQAAASAVWYPPALASQTAFKLEVTISDGSEPPVGGTVEVTVNLPSYAADVQPIWNASCSCHTGAFPSGGLSLGQGASYADLVDAPAVSCAPLLRVLPGFPDDSVLFRKIAGGDCGIRMPFSDPTFFDRNPGQLTLIRSWILAGAADD
jgi:hypothetical protein